MGLPRLLQYLSQEHADSMTVCSSVTQVDFVSGAYVLFDTDNVLRTMGYANCRGLLQTLESHSNTCILAWDTSEGLRAAQKLKGKVAGNVLVVAPKSSGGKNADGIILAMMLRLATMEKSATFVLVTTDTDLFCAGLGGPCPQSTAILACFKGHMDTLSFYSGSALAAKIVSRHDFILLSILFLGADGLPGLLTKQGNDIAVTTNFHRAWEEVRHGGRPLVSRSASSGRYQYRVDVGLLNRLITAMAPGEVTEQSTKKSAEDFLKAGVCQLHYYTTGTVMVGSMRYSHSQPPAAHAFRTAFASSPFVMHEFDVSVPVVEVDGVGAIGWDVTGITLQKMEAQPQRRTVLPAPSSTRQSYSFQDRVVVSKVIDSEKVSAAENAVLKACGLTSAIASDRGAKKRARDSN